jgi:hypothetical protein
VLCRNCARRISLRTLLTQKGPRVGLRMCKRGVAVVFQGLRTGRGRIRAKLLPKGAVGFMRAGVFARTCVCGTHVPVHEPTQARTTPVHEPLAWVRVRACVGSCTGVLGSKGQLCGPRGRGTRVRCVGLEAHESRARVGYGAWNCRRERIIRTTMSARAEQRRQAAAGKGEAAVQERIKHSQEEPRHIDRRTTGGRRLLPWEVSTRP